MTQARLSIALSLSLCAGIVAIMPADLKAAPIGTLDIVGTGNVRVGPGFIDWGSPGPTFEANVYTNCLSGPNPGACVLDGSTTGTFLVTDGTGTFAGLAGTLGTLVDLEDDYAPVGSGFVLPNFLVLAALPGVSFTATSLPPGSGTPAGCTSNPGDVCTIPNSPFTITNLAGGGASVALQILGTVDDGSGVPGTFIGAFSTQFDDLSAAEILAEIATNGYVDSSHSAVFTVTPIPEPSTTTMLGLGGILLALGCGFRRRRAV